MKKLLLLLLLILPIGMSAQTSFQFKSLNKGEVSIKGDYAYISCESNEKGNPKLILEKANLGNLISALETIKTKYIEWTKVAKDNDVKKLSKDIDVDTRIFSAEFTKDDETYVASARITSTFRVIELGTVSVMYAVRLATSTLKSYSNPGITAPGVGLSFDEVKHFDSLIEALKKLKEADESAKNVEDLFN